MAKKTGQLAAEQLADVLQTEGTLKDREKRSFEKEMEDLGVEVVKPQRKWYLPERGREKVAHIAISRTTLTMSEAVIKALGDHEYVCPGVHISPDGKIALALRPATKKTGYKLNVCKPGSPTRRFANARLIARMVADGLQYGKYEAQKVKGGVMAWLIESKKTTS